MTRELQRLEYHVEDGPDVDDGYSEIGQPRLNELGAAGWVMVGAGWERGYSGLLLCRAVFMRPLAEPRNRRIEG